MRIRVFLYTNTDCIRRQEFFDEFWPLDEAESTAVKVVLEADIVGFLETSDTVEVEVIDKPLPYSSREGESFGSGKTVFVDDSKGRRSNGFCDTELATNGSDEGGLASTHFPIKGEDAMVTDGCNEITNSFSPEPSSQGRERLAPGIGRFNCCNWRNNQSWHKR